MKLKKDFWSNELDLIKNLMYKKLPEAVENTIELGNLVCENTFLFREHWEMEKTNTPVTLAFPINWNHMPKDDPEWTFAFNRHSFFPVLAKSWLYTKDEKYSKAFYDLISDWINNVILNEETKLTSWRGLETGLRIENWLRAIMIFEESKIIDKNLEEKIISSLKIHGERLIDEYSIFHTLSNWGVIQNHGLFLIGSALDNKKWQDLAIERLLENLHYQLCNDGTHWEQSPLYHCEVLHCFLNCILVCRNINFKLPDEFYEKTYKMAKALAYMIKPNGYLVTQSDSDEIDGRDILSLGGYLFNDSILKTYSHGKLFEINYFDFGNNIDEFERINPTEFKASVALKDSGNYMLWDRKNKDANFLHYKSGFLGSGHGHSDIFHIDLFAYGENILIDSGRFTYVDNEIRHYLKSPNAHNTVTINDKNFSITKDSWGYSKIAEPLKGEFCFTKDFDYVESSHFGYLDLGIVLKRRVIRLENNLWVLVDFAYNKNYEKEFKMTQYFHFAKDGKVSNKNDNYYFEGKNSEAVLYIPHEDCESNKKLTSISHEYNLLDKSECVSVDHHIKNGRGAFTVIGTSKKGDMKNITCQLLPISLALSNKKLKPYEAEGLKINFGNREYYIIICHNEVISEVDMFRINNYIGYGKVIVFSKNHPKGKVLVW